MSRGLLDPDGALRRVKAGEKLSKNETASIIAALTEPYSEHDRYTLIAVLGHAGLVGYRPIIERYLDSPDDPQLARMALQVLCSWWGLTAEYLDRVESFVTGVYWDESNEVRQMAAISLGRYLRDHADARLLRLLVATATDETEDEMSREDAIRAIAVALGHDDTTIPSAAETEPIDSAWSRAVIDAALSQTETDS